MHDISEILPAGGGSASLSADTASACVLCFVRSRFAAYGAHKSKAVRMCLHPRIVGNVDVERKTDAVIGRARVRSNISVVAALCLVAMPEILLTSIRAEA
jgi:hypothetical protein